MWQNRDMGPDLWLETSYLTPQYYEVCLSHHLCQREHVSRQREHVDTTCLKTTRLDTTRLEATCLHTTCLEKRVW